MDNQGKSPIGEGAAKKETAEERENRLWEETEAKRRAEAAKRLREAAAASAKRREEEDRLWEEGVAKRKAEKEQRLREAAANPRIQEEQRRKEEAETKAKRKVEEQRLNEEIEAKRKAEKEKRIREEAEASAKRKAEEQERLQKTETKRKTEAENTKKAEAASKQKNEQEQRRREEEAKKTAQIAESQKSVTKDHSQLKEVQQGENVGAKKRIRTGLIVVALALIGLWIFSKFGSGAEEEALPLPKIETPDVKDSEPETTKIEPPKAATSFSELAVGDTHEGGIVFEVNQDGRTGKIASTEDAGPMPWQDANKIHEQLGEGWRLPSFHELSKMYRTIGQGAANSGQFKDELYWSATPYDDFQARLLRFRDGNTSYHYNKNVENRKFLVRAVRDFNH